MATIANVRPVDDPLSRVLESLPNESAERRAERIAEDALARQISNEIDEYIKKEVQKKQKVSKLLLLGQAESGKSTTLKNMKLVYAEAAFREERASWPPIIHFNILRHVVRIVNLLEEALDEQAKTKPGVSYEDLAGRQDLFTREHQLLRMKLRPLVEIEATMTKHLMQSLQRRDGEEVAVHSYFAWTKHFHRNADHSNSSSLGDALKGEMRRALNVSCDDILRLWNDPQVRNLLQSQQIQLEHEAGFFLEEDDLKRITALHYEPSDLDVLKARLKTVGVTETYLRVKSSREDWVVYDIGGSRSQRASWKPFFDDVRAIVFLAPLSAFNQNLDEKPTVNRIQDSLLLWRDISGSPLLAGAHLFLFLNKIDLLEKKLRQGIEFRKYLLTYTGSNEVEPICKYMSKKFLGVNKEAQDKMKESERVQSRLVRVFLTSVLDRKATRQVIIDVEETILGAHMKGSSMV